jgi:outer membrane protein assembly factor BamB
MRRAWTVLLVGLLAGSPGPAVPQGDSTGSPRFDIDHDAGRVVRRDNKGKVRWSTPLAGYLGRVRPPHLVWDAQRVYVTHEDGVTALDADSGKARWHSKGPSDRLLLSGDLLLAAGGPVLTARAVVSGAEVFKVRLPAKDSDPLPIAEVAGLFLAQVWDEPGGDGNALLFDREGKVRYRFNRQVVAGLRQGDDRVFLTSRDVVRVALDGKARWLVPFEDREWITGGGLVEMKGGDVVAFLYGYIHDSGVQLVRLKAATGEVVWRARCAPLGVGHSKYRHDATVAVEGERLHVSSRGSYGTFVEVLDLRTGKQLYRRRRRIGEYNTLVWRIRQAETSSAVSTWP